MVYESRRFKPAFAGGCVVAAIQLAVVFGGWASSDTRAASGLVFVVISLVFVMGILIRSATAVWRIRVDGGDVTLTTLVSSRQVAATSIREVTIVARTSRLLLADGAKIRIAAAGRREERQLAELARMLEPYGTRVDGV